MKTDIKSTSLVWQQIAYDWNNYFTSPSRIATQEIRKYRLWLNKINKKRKPLKGLVLGATPELRDALFDSGYEVFSLDINLDMFLAMDELLKNKNSDEVLIKANWLSSPLPTHYFDVILGDAVLPNIPWEKRPQLLKEVSRLLKSNGIFLTRAFCVPEKKPFRGVDEILEHFSKKQQSIMQNALEMVLELQILTYDPKDHLGSFAKAKEALEDYERKGKVKFVSKDLQKAYDIVKNFWCKKFIRKVFVYAYRSEEENSYRKGFKIKEIFEAKDHDYSKITPMYSLEKRS